MSELDSALGDGDFVVFNEKKTKVGFVRIKAMFEGIAYLDIHLLHDFADSPLQAVMSWLSEHYHLGKYYIQLLSNEQREIDCLARLGFTEEARLGKQLFVEGAYCDLLMMGSEDNRV
ncbi:N-acetyltransferase [Enterovibrio sp. 27052020O]|uniref:N-acetyltransferase n=1 Tax=Enterovibrio sp. 27052020O TaxID=3241166 RepID=UPI00388E144A